MRVKITVSAEDDHGLWVAEPTPPELEELGPYAVFAGADCPQKVSSIMAQALKDINEALKPN